MVKTRNKNILPVVVSSTRGKKRGSTSGVKKRVSPNIKKRSTPLAVQYGDFIRVLARHRKKPGEWRKLLDVASKQEIDAVTEVLLNAYRGNIRLSKGTVNKIAKHKRKIEEILGRSTGIIRRKRLLKSGQVGGFLAPLLGALAAPILGPIISGITGAIRK